MFSIFFHAVFDSCFGMTSISHIYTTAAVAPGLSLACSRQFFKLLTLSPVGDYCSNPAEKIYSSGVLTLPASSLRVISII